MSIFVEQNSREQSRFYRTKLVKNIIQMNPDKAKERIKILGLKKQHVAERIGVKLSTLSHYLNGRRDLEYTTKEMLRRYLGL